MGTLNRDIVSTDLAKREGAKEFLGSFVIRIGSETLKDLCENQIPNDNGNFREINVKQVCLPRGNTVRVFLLWAFQYELEGKLEYGNTSAK